MTDTIVAKKPRARTVDYRDTIPEIWDSVSIVNRNA